MILTSPLVSAFVRLVQIGNYSRAASSLGISQPALTKRIQLLESQLGQPLLVRRRKGIQLTQAGRDMLRYSEATVNLESDLLKRFGIEGVSMSAPVIRVGGSASLIHPVGIPALAPIVRENESTSVEFFVRENKDLTTMLLRGQIDYVLTDQDLTRRDCESIEIGHETIIAIESPQSRKNTFLDADVEDDFTERHIGRVFGKKVPYRRAMLQDENGIIEGVRLGYGRALVHLHMLAKKSGVAIVPGSKKVRVPVFLIFRKQDQYSQWHHRIVDLLRGYAPGALSSN